MYELERFEATERHVVALALRVLAFLIFVVAAIAPGVFGAPLLADIWRWSFAAVALLVLAHIVSMEGT